MNTRISFNQINSRILDRLFQNFNKLEGIQEQLSTGKRLNRASDNPVDVANSMEMRAQVDQLDSYTRNGQDGLAYLGTIDTTLGTANNLYQNMRERAIQASNDTNSGTSRMFIGREVRGMFDQMVALANTAFKGEFVFSGTNTQVAPYEIRSGASRALAAPAANSGDMTLTAGLLGTPLQIIDKNVDDSLDNITKDANAYYLIPGSVRVNGLTEGTDFTVDYVRGSITFTAPGAASVAMAAGGGIDMSYEWLRRNEIDMDGVVNREIEEGVSARINTTASEAFGSQQDVSSWEAMINLMEGTINNQPDKIRTSIGQIDTAFQRHLTAQAGNGSRVLRFESTATRNEERGVYTTKLQSELEDVDFAQAVSEFTLQQAVYEASLKMGARAIQNTLVNFL